MKFSVRQISSVDLGKVNITYIHPSHTDLFLREYVIINNKVLFKASPLDTVPIGSVALNKTQREFLNVSIGSDNLEIEPFSRRECSPVSLLKITVDVLNNENKEVDRKEFTKNFKNVYNNFPFNKNQTFYFYEEKFGYKMEVSEILSLDENDYGYLVQETNVYFVSTSQKLSIIGTEENLLLKSDLNFESLGIGGLKKEFNVMFRRAFVQRVFDTEIINKMGIRHVKGIMLYGPPGTGKTLIARQIGSLLNAKPPKIVNGPEILNKYVGQSEENIRNLFKDAELDYKKKKEKSPLHIIIFDEIDAICKSRGTTTTGVGDQVVNQLLSKMDGVECLDNILVIGMTNRIDLIDKALLRPGRFEIHIEVPLPDEQSRFEIFKIHTSEMKKSGFLEESVNLKELAKVAKNYTGAEITAVVKSAVSYALERKVHDKQEGTGIKIVGEGDVLVTMEDFNMAIDEVKPAFGLSEEEFSIFRRVFYELPTFTNAVYAGLNFISKLKNTNLYNTGSLLFYGSPGTGKTTVAVKIALASNFPFVKMISPRGLVGLSEYEKVNYIKDIFMDAYKSEGSVVILDEIETLIDYVSIGPRFSNAILQAIKIFIRAEESNKLLVVGTTSDVEFLEAAGIYDCFSDKQKISKIKEDDFIKLCEENHNFRKIDYNGPYSMKVLLTLLENPDVSNE